MAFWHHKKTFSCYRRRFFYAVAGYGASGEMEKRLHNARTRFS
jgi:hypothetical protein